MAPKIRSHGRDKFMMLRMPRLSSSTALRVLRTLRTVSQMTLRWHKDFQHSLRSAENRQLPRTTRPRLRLSLARSERVKAEECRQNILELSGKAEKLLSTSTLLAGEPKETENKFPGWRTTLRAVTPPKEKAPSEQEKPHDFGVRLRKTGRNLTR